MSDLFKSAWNPREKVVRAAIWMDDYFGRHQYGVAFDGDSRIYKPEDVEIPIDLVLVPKILSDGE